MSRIHVIALVLAISLIVYIIVMPKQGEKFTEFYLSAPAVKQTIIIPICT